MFFNPQKLLSLFALFAVLVTARIKQKQFTQLLSFDAEAHLKSFTLQTINLWSFLCEDVSATHPEYKCSLVFQKNSFDKNKTVKAKNGISCDVNLKLPEHHNIGQVTRIHPLSPHQAVVTWTEMDQRNHSVSLKLLSIDVRDCSKNQENTIEFGPVFTKWFILTTNETFEVAYDDEKTCGIWCSQTFDYLGNKIEGLKNFTVDHQRRDNFIYPTGYNMIYSRIDKCLILESERKLHASLFFSDKLVKTHHSIQSSGVGTSISTDFGILSVCKISGALGDSLNCSRTNLDKWTELKFDYQIQNFMVSSRPDGGYVTLTSKLAKWENKKKPTESLRFILTEFDELNRKKREMNVAHIRCHDQYAIARAQIFQGDKGQICVSMLNIADNVFTARCFLD